MKPPVLLVSLILWFASCKDSPPEPPPPSGIALAVEDASCTEAWLKVSSTAVPATVALTRDGHRVLVSHLTSPDSLLVDQGLLPKHTYTYQAVRLNADSTAAEASAAVQATTMDTTSHNFTWQIDTLGVTSSVLYDVAIINDTLAYAVGEMYLRDSTGQLDPLLYNLAKWNGHHWELKRATVTFRGNQVTVPLEGIFAHSATDIWLAGSIPIHGDGTNWIGYDIQTLVGAGATVSRMWGTRVEMYFVGRAGNIIHYANGTWQRVESGTTVSINDIWGAVDQATGKRTVLCAATNVLQGGEHKLLSISETGTVDTVPWAPQKELRSVWFQTPTRIFTAGEGLFVRRPDKVWREYTETPRIGTERIRGVRPNDMLVAGGFGLVLHWNGVSWHDYPEAAAALVFASVDFKSNLVVAVGYTSTRAVVVQMRR